MPLPCQVAESVTDLIGQTPVVRLNHVVEPASGEVRAKLESCNPGGSTKDRICLNMLEVTEKRGELRPGDAIVEPTSGNTGIGLALAAAVKGYRLVLTADTKGMQGAINDLDASTCTRRLALEEGIPAGISSGAACAAALKVAADLGPGRTVVSIFPDTGERYLTTDLFMGEGI